jgi:hypothetical protein
VSDEKLIRLDNLKRVVAERHYSIKDLTERLGSGYSFWHDLLSERKHFGEKLARKIEDGLQLPRLWLDHVNVPVPPEVADGTSPAQLDLMGLVAQLLHDLAETPEDQRMEATTAAINAVARVRYATTADAEEPETNADDDSPPTKARRKAAKKAPTAGRGAKPPHTAR